MTSKLVLTAIATAAVFVSGSALAGRDRPMNDATGRHAAQDTCRDDGYGKHGADHRHHRHDRHEARASKALRVVPNDSAPDAAAYGWQYFSSPGARYAVVISPAGEYYLSRGDGPKQITGPDGQLLVKE